MVNFRHGHRPKGNKSAAYGSWASMKSRCNNPNMSNYKYYGERGITVCPEWNLFKNFYADMGDPPSPDMTLDRIDVNGNYCKKNCRWATRAEQAANRCPKIIHNKFGCSGISKHRNRFRADFNQHLLGYFLTLEEAIAARKKAEADA